MNKPRRLPLWFTLILVSCILIPYLHKYAHIFLRHTHQFNALSQLSVPAEKLQTRTTGPGGSDSSQYEAAISEQDPSLKEAELQALGEAKFGASRPFQDTTSPIWGSLPAVSLDEISRFVSRYIELGGDADPYARSSMMQFPMTSYLGTSNYSALQWTSSRYLFSKSVITSSYIPIGKPQYITLGGVKGDLWLVVPVAYVQKQADGNEIQGISMDSIHVQEQNSGKLFVHSHNILADRIIFSDGKGNQLDRLVYGYANKDSKMYAVSSNSTSSLIIKDIPEGTRLKIVPDDQNFLIVMDDQNCAGFIEKSAVHIGSVANN